MQRSPFWQLSHIPDAQLVADLQQLIGNERHTLARIVAHLAEVEERRLDLKAGFSSLFDYCLRRLRLSEGEAFRRMTAARVARRFPVIFELIENGAVHLTAVCLLRDFLTPDNHRELLAAVSHKTKKQVEELLARSFPQPDAPSQIRKLPERRAVRAAADGRHDQEGVPASDGRRTHDSVSGSDGRRIETVSGAPMPSPIAGLSPDGGQASRAPAPTPTLGASVGSIPRAWASEAAATSPSRAESPRNDKFRIEPLSEKRYRVQFTAGAELRAKLELARDLLSHTNPSGDFTTVVERALDELIAKLERQRFGKDRRRGPKHPPNSGENAVLETKAGASLRTERLHGFGAPGTDLVPLSAQAQLPRPKRPQHSREDSMLEKVPGAVLSGSECPNHGERSKNRHIPSATRREVLARDGLACTYVDEQGQRCGARAFLQFHHEIAWARGGDSTTDNIRLLCACHNRLLAERDFGRTRVALAVENEREEPLFRQQKSDARSC